MQHMLFNLKYNIWLVVLTLLIVILLVFFVNHILKWFIVIAIIGTLTAYLYNPTWFYNTPEKEAEQVQLNQNAINTLLANTVNVKYQEGKNGSFTITTTDSVVYGTYLSDKATVVANGREVEMVVTPELKAFIDHWKFETERIKKAAETPTSE